MVEYLEERAVLPSSIKYSNKLRQITKVKSKQKPEITFPLRNPLDYSNTYFCCSMPTFSYISSITYLTIALCKYRNHTCKAILLKH